MVHSPSLFKERVATLRLAAGWLRHSRRATNTCTDGDGTLGLNDRDGLLLATRSQTTQKAVTFTVRRGFCLPTFTDGAPGSSGAWRMLGLCLLPTDYRAGAETAHAHSLFQLWLDAADGGVFHEHAGRAAIEACLRPSAGSTPPSILRVK